MQKRRLKTIKTNKRKSSSPFVICVICVVWCLAACTQEIKNDKAVARVFDKYLYYSDIKDIFPHDSSQEDSMSLAKLYIDKWIETQLLLQKAELNLSNEQLDISKELETYRTSLLIYQYEEQWLHEKLDTVVSEEDMQRYYNERANNFTLNDYVVKALYLKIPVDAPNINDVRRWYTSNKEKDMENLTQYCSNYAKQYDDFNEWILWSDIEKVLPLKELAGKQMTQYDRIEQEDKDFRYFVYIKEKKSPGDTAPFIIVRTKVKNIIINKRKLDAISTLEKKVYNDALAKKQFEIFKLD